MLSNLKQIKTLNLMPKLDNNMNKVFKKWKEQYRERRVNMAKRYCLIPFIIYLAKILNHFLIHQNQFPYLENILKYFLCD